MTVISKMGSENVVILCDLHIGVKGGNLAHAKYQLRILDTMIDYMVKHKIDTILQLGDVFDNRSQTKHVILDLWEERFFKKLEFHKITMHTLVGNHDASFKDTIKVNSPRLFLSKYENIKIYDTPTELSLGHTDFIILPWICQDNLTQILDMINKSHSQFVLGHLELANFEMHRGQMSHDGMDRAVFKKFERVFTGHFHTKSSSGNIDYLGCPFELTWADFDDPRGFHTFNIDTHKIRFHKNKEVMFHKIEYDDLNKGVDYWKSFDVAVLSGKILKLYVVNKTDQFQFDMLVDSIHAAGLDDFKIIEEYVDVSADSVDDDEIDLEDSMSLIDSYTNAVEFDGDKVGLKSLMKSLYVQAMHEGI